MPTTRRLPFSPSSVISLKLNNFYDFRSWRDVTRYKMQLQEGLHSTDSTRLPTVRMMRSKQPGPIVFVEN